MNPFRLKGNRPLFDIASYGRAGPAERLYLTAAQMKQVSRTVGRAPEVMVKVTGGKGSRTSSGVDAHFGYISRAGKLEIETDGGERLLGEQSGQELINDWDLDLDEDRPRAGLFASHRRKPPKLIRKIVFSMPSGTPPAKVLAATRDFARKEFGRKHRYAMVLHTNEPHPHVHVTVKAVSEDGVRLDIRRATLRRWREEFAERLRAHGIEANATARRIRGQSRSPKLDSIFRAAQRGESSYMAARAYNAARDQKAGSVEESGAARLQQTRMDVVQGWQAVRDLLAAEGRHQLADQVARFVGQMPPPRTDKQWLLSDMLASTKATSRTKTAEPPVRDPSRDWCR